MLSFASEREVRKPVKAATKRQLEVEAKTAFNSLATNNKSFDNGRKYLYRTVYRTLYRTVYQTIQRIIQKPLSSYCNHITIQLLQSYYHPTTAISNQKNLAKYPPAKEGDAGFPGSDLTDFHWDNTTDEPHRTRRNLILQKYPEIKNLFGYCPKTKYTVLALVSAQFALAYYLKDKMWTMQYWVMIINHLAIYFFMPFIYTLTYSNIRPLLIFLEQP